MIFGAIFGLFRFFSLSFLCLIRFGCKIEISFLGRTEGDNMQIAICEDNTEEQTKLLAFFSKYEKENGVSFQFQVFSSGTALLSSLDKSEYDACFLDIFLGEEKNGIEVARELVKSGCSCPLVFTTTSKDYVFQSFGFHVINYLVKPYTYLQLSDTLDKLLKEIQGQLATIPVLIEGEEKKIPLQRIYSIETGKNHSTWIHFSKDSLRCVSSLSEIEEQLKPYQNFIRCYRSYIINMNYVTGIKENTVFLKNGLTALLPLRDAGGIKAKINDYLWKRITEE